MICGHHWTSYKAKAPLAGWCDDAGVSRLRHSDYGRISNQRCKVKILLAKHPNDPRTRAAERRVGGTQPAVLAHAARSKSIIKSHVIGTASRLVDSSI
jgi:hypothetical protein